MKRGFAAAAQWLCLSMLAVWSLGCSGTQVSLVDTGAIRLETVPSENVYIAWSDAYERDDGFVVTGVIRRRDTVGLPVSVTVDAEVVSASGVILDQGQSDNLYVPRRRVNRAQGFERFTIRFPEAPAQGSLVRIVARGN